MAEDIESRIQAVFLLKLFEKIDEHAILNTRGVDIMDATVYLIKKGYATKEERQNPEKKNDIIIEFSLNKKGEKLYNKLIKILESKKRIFY